MQDNKILTAKEFVDCIRKLKALVYGCRPLGVEVSRLLLQAGIEKIGICDADKTIEKCDSEYLTFGKKRLDAAMEYLEKWDNGVYKGKIAACGNDPKAQVPNYDVIIVTEPLQNLIDLNNECRAKDKKFLFCFEFGLIGSIFVDFTSKYKLKDSKNKTPQKIVYITQEARAKIYLEKQHHLEPNDKIVVSGVKGMVEINIDPAKLADLSKLADKPVSIKIIDPYSIETDIDSSKFTAYSGDGEIMPISPDLDSTFCSLEEILKSSYQHEKQIYTAELHDTLRVHHIHLLVKTLLEFCRKNKGELPKLNEEVKTQNEIYDLSFSQNLEKIKEKVSNPSKQFIIKGALLSRVQLAHLVNLLAGLLVQEVVKMCSMYKPIQQLSHFDFMESINPNFIDLTRDDDKFVVKMHDELHGFYQTVYGENYNFFVKQKILILAEKEREIEKEKDSAYSPFPLYCSSMLQETLLILTRMGFNGEQITIYGTDEAEINKLKSISPNIIFEKEQYEKYQRNIKELLRTLSNDIWQNFNYVIMLNSRKELVRRISKMCATHEVPCCYLTRKNGSMSSLLQIQNMTKALSDVVVKKDKNLIKLNYRPSSKKDYIKWAKVLVKSEFKHIPMYFSMLMKNYQDLYKVMIDLKGYEAKQLLIHMRDIVDATNNGIIEVIKLAYNLFIKVYCHDIDELTAILNIKVDNNKFWEKCSKPQALPLNINEETHIKFIFDYVKMFNHIFGIKTFPGKDKDNMQLKDEELRIMIKNVITNKLANEPYKYIESKESAICCKERIVKAFDTTYFSAETWTTEESEEINGLIMELRHISYDIVKDKAKKASFKNGSKYCFDLLHTASLIRRDCYGCKDKWSEFDSMYTSMRVYIPCNVATPVGAALVEMPIMNLYKDITPGLFKNVEYNLTNGRMKFIWPECPCEINKSFYNFKYIEQIKYIPVNETIYSRVSSVSNNLTVKTMKEFLDKEKHLQLKPEEYQICTIFVRRDIIFNIFDDQRKNEDKPIKQCYEESKACIYPKENKFIYLKIVLQMKANNELLRIPRVKYSI